MADATSASKTITSAGRLRAEVLRIKSQYESNDVSAFKAVQKLYGERAERWARAIGAFEKLATDAKDDIGRLDHIEDSRRSAFASAIGSVRNLLGVAQLNSRTSQLLPHVSEIVLDRLHTLEELSIFAGLGVTIEAVRASTVASELERLIEEIRGDNQTEIDEFLLDRLQELEFVLKNYALFGAEGVQRAVEILVGGGLMRAHTPNSKPPEPVMDRLRKATGVAMMAVNVYVKAASAVQALEWSHEKIQAIQDWISGGN
jgi:hypothetical protein